MYLKGNIVAVKDQDATALQLVEVHINSWQQIMKLPKNIL